LLFVLANYADEFGRCWPSQETLSRGSDQSIDTVQRQLKKLEALGLISRTKKRRAGGQWPSWEYQLAMMTGPQSAARSDHEGVSNTSPLRPGHAATSTKPSRKLCGTNLHKLPIEPSAPRGRGMGFATLSARMRGNQRQSIKEVLARLIGTDAISVWFDEAQIDLTDREAVVVVGTKFKRDWIAQHYDYHLLTAAREMAPTIERVRVVTQGSAR
jgi:hypothetical protein